MNGGVSTSEEYMKEFLDWYGRMHHAYENLLSEEEKASLQVWERENLDGSTIATSDWPGWLEHTGKPPWK